MAEETQAPTAAPEVPQAEEPKPAEAETEKHKPTEAETEKPKPTEEVETQKPKETESSISQSVSFKEESNRVSDLEDPEKKALEELKILIQQALNKHEFFPPPPPVKEEKTEEEKPIVTTEEEKKPICEEPSKPEESEEKKPEKVVEEEKPKEEEKTETPPAPPVESTESTVVVTEVVETVAAVIDEDGSKTVEAIEETIVAVQPSKETEEASSSAPAPAPEPISEPEEVIIWGIPLLCDERSDVILLKFLRARDFKVKEAFTMIKNTVRWRKEFGIDSLLEEDLGTDLEKVVFMNGFDKEGHPVCYNVYGEFQNKELYQKTFADEEKSQKFLRWRIQFLEKSIQKLDFSPNGICTIVQVSDLKNSPGPFKRELRIATNQALSLLQDNYPEFVAKQIFINVPWWYLAFNRMISPFLTQRTKSKFFFAGLSKSTETLFKYIAPEQVPVQYGGLKKEGDHEFGPTDPATEITIRPATNQTVEFPVSETCILVWEIRVVGWDVSYTAEFVPSVEDGYTVIVQKARKIAPSEEPVICNSFKIGEPGKVVLTIDNLTSKKKKLLYRFKTKPASD